MKNVEKLTLYHGSYIIVQNPDVSLCRQGKDFGRGFYLTTSRMQAISFAKTSVRKAIGNRIIPKDTKYGYVSQFTIDSFDGLEVFGFENADTEWLHCVVAHRKSMGMEAEIAKWLQYDVMYGKIANDNTNLVITAYIDGIYGTIGSEKADNIAISFLEPENLKDQFCFRTTRALEMLKYVGNESILL